jgi:tRNA A-37 threonylcarbamoyl transferase component Bud32
MRENDPLDGDTLTPLPADTAPTTAGKAAARVPRPSTTIGSGTGDSAPGSVSSPREALLLVEIHRTRTFAQLTAILIVLVVLTLFVIDADPTARWAHVLGIAPTFVASIALWVTLRDERRYRPWMSAAFALCCGLGIASTFVFWGVFSSAVAVVPIVVYFFASGGGRAPMIAVLLGAALPHAILGTLVATGVIADHGIIRPVALGGIDALAVLGIAQFLFGIAYLLARAHRNSTEEGMTRLEDAARVLAKREALLQEAKQELDRALKVGGPGRFSEQIVGNYRLGNVLGRGAMGEVYEATHVETGASAAMKLLVASAAREPELVQRFMREVKIAAALQVPNVVRVLETPVDDQGVPFLAMERLFGETLSDVLRARPRLPLSETITLVTEVARGLAAAHAAGVVHRDIKPQNVFAHRDGDRIVWKILDFGISRLTGSETLTKDQLIGTPPYMAPEQARGGRVDHRADLYSLGVIAYRTLTGRPAFAGKDTPSVLLRVIGTMPPAPSASSSLDVNVDAVLAVAMAKSEIDRFQSADELIAAFEALGSGTLAPEIRERAARATKRHPWGSNQLRVDDAS